MNQYDENEKPHGLWESYHPNGQLYYKGEYRHGKEHGLWEYYWSDGKLHYKGENKKGKGIGLWYYLR